jgi:hypothetical protein
MRELILWRVPLPWEVFHIFLVWKLKLHIAFLRMFGSLEELAPAKFQVIWTPFGSLKVKNIEKEVFWFSQVNPIKLGNM